MRALPFLNTTVLIGPLELAFANFCLADGGLHAAAGAAAVIGRAGVQPAALVVHRSKTANRRDFSGLPPMATTNRQADAPTVDR